MWYFTWILGLGFAVLLAIVNALWLEAQDEQQENSK
jgi:cyd operon protein YbgT